jgi:outer membrane protein TolC
LLARAVETDFEPVALPEIDPNLEDPMAYVRGSLLNRPEVKQAETSIEALTKNREAEQRAALPTLTLQAGHTEIIDPGFGQPDRTTSASATVSVPIVTGGAIRANTQKARELEERGKILLQQLQLAVAFEVRSAITQFETAVASYETAAQNRVLAEESLRLAQLRYDEQVGILLDVTIGQADLTAAQSAEVVAAYQLRAAYAALQKAVGIDDLKNLPEPTPAVEKEEGK